MNRSWIYMDVSDIYRKSQKFAHSAINGLSALICEIYLTTGAYSWNLLSTKCIGVLFGYFKRDFRWPERPRKKYYKATSDENLDETLSKLNVRARLSRAITAPVLARAQFPSNIRGRGRVWNSKFVASGYRTACSRPTDGRIFYMM